MFWCDLCIESDWFSIDSCLNDLINSFKSTTTDKQDVRCINLDQFLMWMLSSALRWNRRNCSFDDFQKCLLNTFSGNISCDGWIFWFSCDLINLINVNDSVFCTLDVSVCCLNHLKENIFNVLSYISGLCQCCSICDCKWNIQDFRKCLCQKCLTTSCWSKHQDITLLKFYSKILFCQNSLIMIVNCNRKNFLRLILSNHIFVQKSFHLFRCQEINIVKCSSVIKI